VLALLLGQLLDMVRAGHLGRDVAKRASQAVREGRSRRLSPVIFGTPASFALAAYCPYEYYLLLMSSSHHDPGAGQL
jgi:hypothetical protein